MICFFDTESTGLPRNWKAQMSDLDNWPRVIQLAWLIADLKGDTITSREVLIKPDGWTIPAEDFWIDHGFNTETNEREGTPMPEALSGFLGDLEQCEYLVSHNMDFDHKVLGAEMIRYNLKGKRCLKICTKEMSTEFCAIPFGGDRRPWMNRGKRFKWPTMGELHKKLFKSDIPNQHHAGGDVAALKNCFFELVRLRIIKLETQNHDKFV